jgi:hypothetical protein
VDTNSEEDINEHHESSLYKLLMTPYRQLDEVSRFQSIIRNMKGNELTRQHYEKFVEDLPISLKNFVNESMNLATMKFDDGRTKIRRILKVNKNSL